MIYKCPLCYRPMSRLTIDKKVVEADRAAECDACSDPKTGEKKKFVAIKFEGKSFWQELLPYVTAEGD